ncbi:adenosine deaminase [Cryptosporangium phraense]|uniref:adenosine deaminase n=1 Tax=Cryptosporangium phraense TaxID=2593070 RepID=A0A545AFX5_9ACTN|nr:adenosine deaminase [Cryptosporangium phraense]TQS40181.1 adenosine deaminase [Cryptosporangium phraense]
MYPRWADAGDPLLALPKVTLHDHLDGSLRPETMLELADAQGQSLPYADPDTLAGWFQGTVAEPVVDNWDEKFGVTTRLMQDPDSIVRVAHEFVLDLAADGVVYGETRWAPEKHVGKGMSLSETVEAVAAGLASGEQAAAAAGRPIRVRQLLCGMRTSDLSTEIAKLTIQHYGDSVAGFDVAGVEEGFPASEHVEACRLLEAANVPFTFHTGEHDGVSSIASTVHDCHALRLGHGVRIVEDIFLDGVALDIRSAVATVGSRIDSLTLGPLARWVRDRRIPLEVCLSSNSKGNVVDGWANHPLGLLKALGFTVTMNPDNRMMSATSLTRDMRRAVETFGFGAADLLEVTRNAAEAAFLPLADRTALIADVIEPGFGDLHL